MEGSGAECAIAAKKYIIEQDYDALSSKIPDFDFTLAEFADMLYTVNSLRHGDTIDKKHTEFMVPFADMVRHRFPGNAKWDYDAKKGFYI